MRLVVLSMALALFAGCGKPVEATKVDSTVATARAVVKAVEPIVPTNPTIDPLTALAPSQTPPRIEPSKQDLERQAKEEQAKEAAARARMVQKDKAERDNAAKKLKEDELVNFDGQDYKNREKFLTSDQISLLKEMNRWLIDKKIVDVQFPGNAHPSVLDKSYNDFIFSKINVFNKDALRRYYQFLADNSKECKEYLSLLKPKNVPVADVKQRFMLITFDEKLEIQRYLAELRSAGRPGDIEDPTTRRFVTNNPILFDIK